MALAFSNFADREIRYEVYYHLGGYNLVLLPHKVWQKYREYESLRKKYFELYKKEPSIEELSSNFNLVPSEVYDVYQQVALQNPFSLDQKIYSEDKANYSITVKDRVEDPFHVECKKLEEDQEVLILALNRMSSNERKIFVMLHNLCDLVQEIPPDQNELINFFTHKNFKFSEKTTLRFPTLKV
jgi:DNA-directed RNA polymerase specialized sigma subunit